MDLGEKNKNKNAKKNETNIAKMELSSVSEGFVALALTSESFNFFFFGTKCYDRKKNVRKFSKAIDRLSLIRGWSLMRETTIE